MADDHLQRINHYFGMIKMLKKYQKDLHQRIKYSEIFLNSPTNSQQINSDAKSQDVVAQREAMQILQSKVDKRIGEFTDTLFRAGEFDTKKLTKYLANVLTNRTGATWLPIRFLLKPGSCYVPQVEGYGVLLAETLFVLPGLPETLTLLDHKDHTIYEKSVIKYRESSSKPILYENIDSMDHIWMFSSGNFISIGADEKFNAFFNNNHGISKPFLHVCLSEENVQTLHSLEDKSSICYGNYSVSDLPETHPRRIAMETIANLVDARIGKIEASQDKQENVEQDDCFEIQAQAYYK